MTAAKAIRIFSYVLWSNKGHKNAPHVFQHFVQAVFEPLIRENKILIDLDNLLIATKDIDEHIKILSKVFEVVGKHHLQFRLDVIFVQTEIKYLGYCVNAYGEVRLGSTDDIVLD